MNNVEQPPKLEYPFWFCPYRGTLEDALAVQKLIEKLEDMPFDGYYSIKIEKYGFDTRLKQFRWIVLINYYIEDSYEVCGFVTKEYGVNGGIVGINQVKLTEEQLPKVDDIFAKLDYPYWFAPNRGSLLESLKEQRKINKGADWGLSLFDSIEIDQYCFDVRLGQFRWIVTANGNVVGFITKDFGHLKEIAE